jgi:hypothetical protein
MTIWMGEGDVEYATLEMVQDLLGQSRVRRVPSSQEAARDSRHFVGRRDGQVHTERGARSRNTLHFDTAPVRFDDPPDDV